ncbi:MAG TPA: phenylacetate--CoA ligase family protein [Telluria sp.]|nr:phenylacetate--CoA ligase family protein [Telluria sp.]
MWKYSLKYSWRSLVRELARNIWARLLVYPRLAANERSPEALAAYIGRRTAKLRMSARTDGLGLPVIGPESNLMCKHDLRSEPARFTRPRLPGSLIRARTRTSGTSGSPLTFKQSIGCIVREEAFLYRQLRWMGYRHGQRRAWIRGETVCDPFPADGVYWCRDYVGKMLMMSSYHMTSATIPRYVAALEEFDPAVIHAYPSSIAALAMWMKANGRHYHGRELLGVMTSSETLDDATREAVLQAFGVRVFDWYGQAERVAAIGTCELGIYHVLTDYSLVELMTADGELEIVGTSLNNRAVALARYRTGDTVEPAEGRCPCGRVFPLVKSITGRRKNAIRLPDGRQISLFDHIFRYAEKVMESQVVYRGGGEFVLKVVPAAPLHEADKQDLLQRFLRCVPGVRVSVEVVEMIARGPNGKFQFVANLDVG